MSRKELRGGELEVLRGYDERKWSRWLAKNHGLKKGAWLVFFKKGSGLPSIGYDEALDAALCHGWIDSVIMRIDETSYARKFTPRRPGSIWSKSNIERVNRLHREGKMTEAGMKLFRNRPSGISRAEQFKVRQPPFPKEFLAALKKDRMASVAFEKFAPSHKKRYLMWITAAKTKETRDRRIDEAVKLIRMNVKSLLK